MLVEIRDVTFDPQLELRRYETCVPEGKFGASVVFIGSMRDFNDGASVEGMTLDHYPGMTEKHLARIAEEACRRWEVVGGLIVHRVGQLMPNDPIVLIAVWTAHRSAAFDCCRYIIEELKSRAPFWKKEKTGGGDRWVEKNTEAEPRN